LEAQQIIHKNIGDDFIRINMKQIDLILLIFLITDCSNENDDEHDEDDDVKIDNSYWYGKVMNLDTSMMINSNRFDSVDVIMEYSDPPGYNYYYSKYYYARNIGIIKYEEWFLDDSATYEENLIEYEINN